MRRACGGEPGLAAHVGDLLTANEAAAAKIPTEPPAPLQLAPPPPTRIGPYRLTGRLGEGGMGEVFLGERDDGLFAQQVAIKLMRPTMLADTSLSYFERERRILARLRHPNIAQLFDGGVDPQGRPYFIMERLEAVRIDDFARERALAPAEVVRLFLQVCAAVQYAHQNLIVHADIKPSNVLVDGDGTAKLVDFGVGQLVSEGEQEGQEESREEKSFPITPAYASPRRRGGARPALVDDVYALGVLLDELLTAAVRGYPRAPSSSGARTDVTLSDARALDPDLAAVAAKARADAAEARYGTAAALADDLQRWLERRPVSARSGGRSRASLLFVRRHPLAMGAATAAVTVLVAALGVITSLYLDARQARAAAEARYADARTMAKYLVFDTYDRLDRVPRTLPVRMDLARVGQSFLDRLATDGAAPDALKLEAIDGLVRLAEVQAGAGQPNLGQVEAARRNLTRAAGLARAMTHDAPGRARAWLAAARVDIARARFATEYDNAVALSGAQLAAAKRAIDTAEDKGEGQIALARIRAIWATRMTDNLEWRSRYVPAIQLAQGALTALDAPALRGADLRAERARLLDVLGDATYYSGDPQGSESIYRRGADMVLQFEREAPNDLIAIRQVAHAQWQLGSNLADLGRWDEALAILKLGLERVSRLLRDDPDDKNAARLAMVLNTAQAQTLAGAKRFPEAIALYKSRVDRQRRAIGEAGHTPQQSRDYAIGEGGLGDIYAAAGQQERACASYARSAKAFEGMRSRGHLSRFDLDTSFRAMLKSREAARCFVAGATGRP